MSPNIVYLGWAQPWTALFGGWLEREPDRLRRRLVVVPTRESGRRLREWLVRQAVRRGSGAVLGPRVATPDDFFRPDLVMPDAIRWAAWLRVLRETKEAQVATLFPAGLADQADAWCLAIIRQIEQARELLMAANADCAAVAQNLSEDHARWHELARLEQRVVDLWKQWGFADPVQAKRARALAPVRPLGVDEIVLAGVTDPTWLAVEAWQRLVEQALPITVLVGAPEGLREAFDDWGRPKPEYWADRRRHTTPEPTVSLVAADAEALAMAVVQACAGRANLDVAVGVCDSTLAPAVARRFQEAGWPTFDPEGVLLAKDGWPELLEALAAALEAPDQHVALARVARHPAVWATWLEDDGAKATLAALEQWELEHAASSAAATLQHLGASRQADEKAAAGLLARVHSQVQAAAAGRTDALVSQIRQWLPAGAPEVASRVLAEMESWPQLRREGFGLPLCLRWLATSLAAITRSSDSSDAVLALQGWLELPFDPAPHLILAGVHEGRVPETPPAQPLITEGVRERLGLRDRKSRIAREAFLYTAMVEGRRACGSVTVVTAQVDARGEPCRPSRVLLQAAPAALPARVLKFVQAQPDVPLPATPPWSRADWTLRPPADIPRNKAWEHLSPSTLKTYLACPTRFYFQKVLGWEPFEPFADELDARRFGDLLHAVLREWGHDTQARELTDAVALRNAWWGSLRRTARDRFGPRPPALVQLQIRSAEERLAALAEKQAAQPRLGWHVAEVEKPLNGILTLAGLPLHLQVDRIDRHDDGRFRVVDYKTGKRREDPRQAHLRIWSDQKCPAPLGPLCVVKPPHGKERACGWIDLQLPLYVAAVQKEWQLEAPPEAYYARLPEATADTDFVPFVQLTEKIGNALQWAEEAARRIRAGVFWPPAPAPDHDDFAALAPDGLPQALASAWADFLGRPPPDGPRPAA
jgi:ATP-dependent helicase/nuclease subunit B